MITLEILVAELQQAPPEHLEEVHRVLHELQVKADANKKLAAETMRILNGMEELSAEDWAEIEAYQRQQRAELFTRPNPFRTDEADAA